MRIRKIKKIIVILIIMTMLQTQIVSLSNVAWAITAEMTGQTEQGGLGTEAGGEVKNETVVTEEIPSEELEEELSSEIEEEIPEEVPKEDSEDLTEENAEEISDDVSEGNEDNNTEELPSETPEVPSNETEEPSDQTSEMPEETVVEPKIELNITSENSSIYKGYLYANATSDLRYETNYNTIEELTIQGSENGITGLVVKENEDKIKMITTTKLALFNDIYYKKTRVSVEEFNSILGENGLINIFDADGDFVGYIDKESPVENGCYVYEFIYYTNSVRYELSNPIADGTIRIINDKAIKEDSIYSKEQIATFSTINVIADAEMIVGENVLTASGEGDINLQETESKIEIELDKTELSTEDENELTMTLTLKTDAERYELFEDPVMEVEMPSNVNELTIEGINLLYKNGLSLKNWEVVENDNRNKVLRIEMEGAQSVYTPGMVQQGTTLVVYLKANVNKLTANTSENLKLRYTNQDCVRQAYILEGKDAEELLLTFVAKHGMLKGATATNISTLTVGSSYEDEVDKVEVKSMVEEQTVTLTGTIVNNFEKEVDDVVVVGRIPFIGNKNGNGDELLSDFDTILKSEIITSGNIVDIYYSENGDATQDDESWSQDVSDMSKYKSYKIVVQEGTLKKGESVKFSYDVTIPENLGYNLKSYATYTVNYKLDNQELSGNCTIALVSEVKELEAEDMEQQEEVEKLKIGTQVSQGGRVLTAEDSVYERQILRYTVVVTNTSKETLTNIKLTGKAENANMYTWLYTEHPGYNGYELYIAKEMAEDTDGTRSQDEMIIDVLNPGESKTFEYQVIAKDLKDILKVVEESSEENIQEELEPNVYGIITVSGDNIEEKIVETIKNEVVDGELELRVAWAGTESTQEKDTTSGAGFSFYVYVENISDENLENVELDILIPNELEFNEEISANIEGIEGMTMKVEPTTDGKKVMLTIPNFQAQTSKEIYLRTYAKSMDYSIERNTIKVTSIGKVNDTLYYSNDYMKDVFQGETKLEHKWESNVNKEIVENGEEITFELLLKNIGVIKTGLVSINGNVPNGLIINDASIIYNDVEEKVEVAKDKDGNLLISIDSITIEPDTEFLLRINTKVDENYFRKDQESLDFKLEIDGGYIDKVETDVISYKISNKNVTVEEQENNVNTDTDDENINNDSQNNNNETTNNDKNTSNDNIDSGNENNDSNNTNLQNPDNQINKPSETEEITKTYIISGKVWLDENRDGINKNEPGMKSVVVMLYKTTDKGNITSKVKEEVTNENGEYTFTSVESGNYVVVFSYDTSLYSSTKYHVSTASTSENSDAITKAVSLENYKDIFGITDVITINESGAINVDLGLVSKNEFDLSLEKHIDSATVTNASGIKVYEYDEDKNVKLEIHSKYFKDSTIDITYKIKVENTGEVTGYVNKIVDYVPEDMKFDNNKNPEWYYGDDGYLYYKGLVGTEISPNSTKEITLTLTKVLDKGEAVKLVNGAEIAESTNSIGLLDVDSTPANQQKQEDDYGEVTLMITISTGSTKINITILIITLLIIMIIVYISRFKTTKKVYR